MPRRLRTFNCEDCGAETTRKRESGQALICPACSSARANTAIDQQHAAALERRDLPPRLRGLPGATSAADYAEQDRIQAEWDAAHVKVS